jgi:hypothetical protein
MAQMIRKQLYVEPQQDAALKRLAQKVGLSKAELVRQAIDRLVSAASAGFRDLDAWEREKNFIADRMAAGSVPGTREWHREAIYEERLDRKE